MASQISEQLQEQIPVQWGAILAGSFVSLGIWLFLYALGAAIGGGVIVRGQPDTWTGIYTLVSPIIALFFGGLLTARARGLYTRMSSAVHGAVVWGFSMVIGLFLLSTLGAGLLGGRAGGGVNVPSGYPWAVAASMFCSLLAALFGAAAGLPHVPEVRRRETTTREVYP